MAYVPQSGSVVSYQNQPSSLLSGASIFGQLPAGTAPLGSVAALQGTNPWITNINHSVATVIIGGSIAASFTPPANQSVSGRVETTPVGTIITSLVSTVPSSVIVGASVFGNVGISGTPNVNTAGSVVAFQSNPSVLQVLAGLMSTNASIITAGGTTGNSSVQVDR